MAVVSKPIINLSVSYSDEEIISTKVGPKRRQKDNMIVDMNVQNIIYFSTRDLIKFEFLLFAAIMGNKTYPIDE